MRKITVSGASPQDNGAAFVADNATLAGAVELEENCSIWYGAVLRADTGRIRVGRGSNVQDNAVLHTGPGLDILIGENASIGHSAVVHGCTIGDGALIGMHATVMNGEV
ncbi:MAG: gamma carbonic anhydrase family protein, partial [Gemmiger sp.]|uniref:gamma carbonic anhydrase family protein n=1 Tax=Gemmiger sp. TaxID=2049027 RepID=UPI002A7F7394